MPMRPTLWTVNGLATEVGLDRRQVAKHLAGIAPDGKAGSQDAWLLKTYLAAAFGGRSSSYGRERTRWMKIRADALEREERVKDGKLVPVDDILKTWGIVIGNFRTRLLAMEARLAPRWGQVRSARDLARLIHDEVYAALDDLSKTRVPEPEENLEAAE